MSEFLNLLFQIEESILLQFFLEERHCQSHNDDGVDAEGDEVLEHYSWPAPFVISARNAWFMYVSGTR